jgi:hypothetical protein
MKAQRLERWQQLCASAAEGQDAAKLLAIVKEINKLLEEKEQRLKKARNYNDSQTTPQA